MGLKCYLYSCYSKLDWRHLICLVLSIPCSIYPSSIYPMAVSHDHHLSYHSVVHKTCITPQSPSPQLQVLSTFHLNVTHKPQRQPTCPTTAPHPHPSLTRQEQPKPDHNNKKISGRTHLLFTILKGAYHGPGLVRDCDRGDV